MRLSPVACADCAIVWFGTKSGGFVLKTWHIPAKCVSLLLSLENPLRSISI